MLERVVRKVGSSTPVRRTISETGPMRGLTGRFIGGLDEASAVETARAVHERGLLSTLHVRRGAILDERTADQHVEAYADLARRAAEAGLGSRTEISVKMAQFGLLAPGGFDAAMTRLTAMVDDACSRGISVTVDMEGAEEVDLTLEAVRLLRERHPDVGIALQSYLFRTEADCAALATAGSRVRLIKGAYGAGPDIAHTSRAGIDAAFVRCTRRLMDGDGYPMIATHDLRLVAITRALAAGSGRDQDGYEFQMLMGVRTREQLRLAAEGERVRVYIPYGPEWYPWFLNRMVERPSNVRLLVNALVTPSGAPGRG